MHIYTTRTIPANLNKFPELLDQYLLKPARTFQLQLMFGKIELTLSEAVGDNYRLTKISLIVVVLGQFIEELRNRKSNQA